MIKPYLFAVISAFLSLKSFAHEIKVMSFNIRYASTEDHIKGLGWQIRKNNVAEIIAHSEADFVGIQEALQFQILDATNSFLNRYFNGNESKVNQHLTPELRSIIQVFAVDQVTDIESILKDPKYEARYEWIGAPRASNSSEASPIFYRADKYKLDKFEGGVFWFSDQPLKYASASFGNSLARICTWARFIHLESGKGIYVYSVHLDNKSEASRDKSVELLAEYIHSRRHPEEPLIVLGDFNAPETENSIRYLKGEIDRASAPDDHHIFPIQLVDVYREIHPEEPNPGTFHAFSGVTQASRRLDYIFVSKGFHVKDAGIQKDHVHLMTPEGENMIYPSDHFPVWAVLHRDES